MERVVGIPQSISVENRASKEHLGNFRSDGISLQAGKFVEEI